MLKDIIDQINATIDLDYMQEVSVCKATALTQLLSLDRLKKITFRNRDSIDFYNKIENNQIENFKNFEQLLDFTKKEKKDLRINSLHEHWDVLEEIKNYLLLYYGILINCNLYFTNGGDQSLEAHRDYYPILIYQIKGEKLWKLEGQEEFVIKEGEFFVLPSGREHEAKALDDSAHIAFGLYFPGQLELFDAYLTLNHLKREINYNLEDNLNFDEKDYATLDRLKKISPTELQEAYRCLFSIKRKSFCKLPLTNNGAKIDNNIKYILDSSRIMAFWKKANGVEVITLNEKLSFKGQNSINILFDLISMEEFTPKDYFKKYPGVETIYLFKELMKRGLLKDANLL